MRAVSCRNSVCDERLDSFSRFGFCPSCWAARKVGIQNGAMVAAALAFAWNMVPWLKWTKLALGAVFN